MRRSGKCPKCDSRQFYVVDEATVPDEYWNTTKPFALAAGMVNTNNRGFWGADEERLMVTVTAWVCAACAATEVCEEFGRLRRLSEEGAATVRLVDNEAPQSSPFR